MTETTAPHRWADLAVWQQKIYSAVREASANYPPALTFAEPDPACPQVATSPARHTAIPPAKTVDDAPDV